MIKGNVIELGYGDVCIGADPMGFVHIQNIKPPYPPGTTLTDKCEVELLGERITIRVSTGDLSYITEVCKEVRSGQTTTFPFHGYLFDFSKYDEESVRVLEEKVRHALAYSMLAMAC